MVGSTISLADGRLLTVVKEIGEGGQGVVYKVNLQTDNGVCERALKWYFVKKIDDPRKFYKRLEENIRIGAPSSAFVWPEVLTKWNEGEPFGYIMPLFPEGYEGFSKYLLAKVNFPSLSVMIDAAINIVTAFQELHNKGYNYQDLNDGNFAIRPSDGDVLICDNDNVVAYGNYSDILGKLRYMAPEIVRGESRPDKYTDRFSLAVVLFMLLFGGHPLEGKKTNVPALTAQFDKIFFGTEPLFVFDDNPNNRPVNGLHKNVIRCWQCYPTFIREAFKKAFSQESLMQRKGRLLEQEWIALLMRLKSSISKCPKCGYEIFLESSESVECSNKDCRQMISPVGYIDFRKLRSTVKLTVPIFRSVNIYSFYMSEYSHDYHTIAATILFKPGKCGIKNLSNYSWTVHTPSGNTYVVKRGDVAVLGSGVKLDFGNGNIAEVINNKLVR